MRPAGRETEQPGSCFSTTPWTWDFLLKLKGRHLRAQQERGTGRSLLRKIMLITCVEFPEWEPGRLETGRPVRGWSSPSRHILQFVHLALFLSIFTAGLLPPGPGAS